MEIGVWPAVRMKNLSDRRQTQRFGEACGHLGEKICPKERNVYIKRMRRCSYIPGRG